MINAPSTTVADELDKVLPRLEATPGCTTGGDKTLFEQVAEHEAFLTLLEIVDTARARKSALLDLIDDAKTLAVDRLPFGEDAATNAVLSPDTEQHVKWLRLNLERTNEVLDAALGYLRMLYGPAYMPSR
jgi:hypothetical protein